MYFLLIFTSQWSETVSKIHLSCGDLILLKAQYTFSSPVCHGCSLHDSSSTK